MEHVANHIKRRAFLKGTAAGGSFAAVYDRLDVCTKSPFIPASELACLGGVNITTVAEQFCEECHRVCDNLIDCLGMRICEPCAEALKKNWVENMRDDFKEDLTMRDQLNH